MQTQSLKASQKEKKNCGKCINLNIPVPVHVDDSDWNKNRSNILPVNTM